jgi:hypothetical protein
MSLARLEPLSCPPVSLASGGSRRERVRLALIARWRAAELDRDLAAGASPDASALLALRGQRITSRRHRARTADGLARAARDARAATRGFSAAVAPDRREVLAARTVLAAVERRLRAAEPASAQGVAVLWSLLTDGTSPLYRPSEHGMLGRRLRAAAAVFEPVAGYDPARAGQAALG